MRVFTAINLAAGSAQVTIPKFERSVNHEGKAAVFFLVALQSTSFADQNDRDSNFNVYKKYGDF